MLNKPKITILINAISRRYRLQEYIMLEGPAGLSKEVTLQLSPEDERGWRGRGIM